MAGARAAPAVLGGRVCCPRPGSYLGCEIHPDFGRAEKRDITVNRSEITAFIATQTQNIVQTGPFKGMRLSRRASWGDGDVGPKLLGLYEQELHESLIRFSEQDYQEIVDIGAAEGYYAVGAARLFPQTRIVRTYDTNEVSHDILRENAALNGVSDKIVVGGLCDGAVLRGLAQGKRLLVILDCEGGELAVFEDAAVVASLRHSDLIIECHDFMQAGITGLLVTKFFPTHLVEVIYSAGRNPNAFPFLAFLSDEDRWQAVSERRPSLMNWIVCRSKSPQR